MIDMPSSTLQIDTPSVVLTPRKVAVQGEDRITWRLCSLATVLGRCRGHQTSTAVLHILLWALRSHTSRSTFLEWWSGQRNLSMTRFRFDPQVDVTIDLALALGLVQLQRSGKVKLSDSGTRLFDVIWSMDDTMIQEKALLSELPDSLPETEVRRRLGWDERS
jgi:hypothetical protein